MLHACNRLTTVAASLFIMPKITPISGFPEWLPEQKIAEERIISIVRSVYESFGFVPIETPAVEQLETLGSKGVIDREIYVVKRYHAEDDQEASLGLRFDLTVPFARYVAQHLSDLIFPFKRYQLQRVWRGERPQKGRFREFYQFDIDVIARDELPLCLDAEVLTAISKAFAEMNVGASVMLLNSRKILHGCYAALGVADDIVRRKVITAVDKLHKIGPDGVREELARECSMSSSEIDRVLALTNIRATPAAMRNTLAALDVEDVRFAEGVREMEQLFELIPPAHHAAMQVDLSLARGLDYYTGVVFEVQLKEHPQFGTVASGGRYDDLASQFTNQKLPGVGGSIGITRLMELLFTAKLVETARRTTAVALVTVASEQERRECNQLADTLRTLGINTEVYFKSPKLGKQIEFADTKGIPYVFFRSADGSLEVKDLRTKVQEKVADLAVWAQAAALRLSSPEQFSSD